MIYKIDIDGVLCQTTIKGLNRFYDYSKSIPNYEVIKKVNKLYNEGHVINIWTSRGSISGISWKNITIRQLKEWGVLYHFLSFDKPVFDVIIDDKAVNVKDW